MARSLRFQYPGAIYHVMARGDGVKTVFENKDDCEVFLYRLDQAKKSEIAGKVDELEKM